MKSINKIIIFTSLSLCTFISKAQDDGKVTINTIYDDPKKNSWDVGIALAGIDIQNQTSGGLYYLLHGRYTLGKLFTFQLNTALDLAKIAGGGSLIQSGNIYSKFDPYTHIEARASFHFSDKEGTMSHKISLGQDSKYKYSTNYTSKSRNIFGVTASINIHNHVGMQIDDSSSSKRVMTLTDGSGNNVGFKKLAGINQKNMILGIGIFMGQYTHYKGKFTGGAYGSTKTRRLKKSMSTSIELLLGINLNMGDKAYWQDDNKGIHEYKVKDVEKKRIGWRITSDYGKNKVGLFHHFELGMRPGLSAPNKQSKYLNQGYLSYGIGFGF